MTLRGVATTVAVFLAVAGLASLMVWHHAHRLTRRYCVSTHVRHDTCFGMMPLDGRGGSMPYMYDCDETVCDAWRCERRGTPHMPWEETPCRH